MGGPLQLVDLLAGLVPDRRSHLPGLLCGSPASPDWQYVDHGNAGRFLVCLPTQRLPVRARLAPNPLSFLAVSSTGRDLSTHLSADAPPPADDRHALANGSVRGTADPQALTHSGSQECSGMSKTDQQLRLATDRRLAYDERGAADGCAY